MLKSLVIGIGLTLSIVFFWALVQALWKKTFREEYSEDDVLAGRRSCSNCGCTTACATKGSVDSHEDNTSKNTPTIKINYRT
ncbi:hypothetical protein [Robertkochia sediminum]|uniref:hypothetical protein n=1 Tax=Robertkochia sediminum TaxID=2785326 RepID=UPI00193138C8|nr:hypothetical protein [Robertkochia sediminum]MBL7472203.1 hypothetical protein [Robertkochia sediminum]